MWRLIHQLADIGVRELAVERGIVCVEPLGLLVALDTLQRRFPPVLVAGT
ncbi:MAG: hypothetical protein H0W36_09395 [Gemmatimonadetes bacterium]|nr:hypothetical protein [Gemmatimonadota bacterium]